MIQLKQGKVATSDKVIQNVFNNKLVEFEVGVDVEKVRADIEKLKKLKADTKNKINEKNIDICIKELERLEKLIDKETNKVEIGWSAKDGLAYSYPFNMITDRGYGIDCEKYFKPGEKQKLLELDYSQLSQIIAFELISEELGESIESIDELTETAGIGSINEASILTDNFEDDMLELSKVFKIGISPYITGDKEYIEDYFNRKKFKLKTYFKFKNDKEAIETYRDVVKYSCKYALSVIAATMIDKMISLGYTGIKLIGISDSKILFILEDKEDVGYNLKDYIDNDIVVRSFGKLYRIDNLIIREFE